MAHPCPERERSWWPAFSPTGDNKPFTGKQADALLHSLLPKVMTETEAAKRSWHSFLQMQLESTPALHRIL